MANKKEPSPPKIFSFRPSLVLIGGKSGIGKTTIVDTLIKLKSKPYIRPLSFTSRSKRPNESDNEYIFVNKDDIYKMSNQNEILTIDEVYGNLYAISRKSLTEILNQNKIPIKEVHPTNHDKIKKIFPSSISVLIITGQSEVNIKNRKNGQVRIDSDEKYFSNMNSSHFDIIFKTNPNEPADALAENFHYLLYSYLSTNHYFPNPNIIDSTNFSGYNKVAYEFDENKRITTKNFHTLSYPFFLNAVKEYVNKNMKCIEIGPGRGWLKNNMPFPVVDYVGVDISQEMINNNNLNINIKSSVSSIDFPDEYFDIAFASLADPYFYPSAICEIRRVLKKKSVFIFSSPSRYWSDGIRDEKEKLMTNFVMSDKSIAKVFSFTFTMNELKELLTLCGFSVINYSIEKGINLPPNENISPAITESANYHNIRLNDLPILNLVIAKRE